MSVPFSSAKPRPKGRQTQAGRAGKGQRSRLRCKAGMAFQAGFQLGKIPRLAPDHRDAVTGGKAAKNGRIKLVLFHQHPCGKVDGFICAVGSGGTLAGVAMALQPKGVKIGLADPEGAALYSFYTTGQLDAPGSSITEGIGQGRITANLEGFTPDFSYRIPDAEALPLVFSMVEEEGICLGGSSGVNIAGAIRMAREMGPGHTIVTILCDYGNRYQSKLYNPAFLKEKGLPVPRWLDRAPMPIPSVFLDA